MADKAEKSKDQAQQTAVPAPQKSKMPFIIMGAVVVIAIGAFFGVTMSHSKPEEHVEAPSAEYSVTEKLYQLKDGSYLKLGFTIVVEKTNVAKVKEILEHESPGRLPNALTMILGNKTREDLINGMHKREAFAREVKKMLEEQVFAEFNKKQSSSKNAIEIREVLISNYVTQAG